MTRQHLVNKSIGKLNTVKEALELIEILEYDECIAVLTGTKNLPSEIHSALMRRGKEANGGKTTLEVLFRGKDRDEVMTHISDFNALLQKGVVLTLDGYRRKFKGFMTANAPEKTISKERYKSSFKFTGYWFSDDVTISWQEKNEIIFETKGNRWTPCRLTITALEYIETMKINGLSDEITIKTIPRGEVQLYQNGALLTSATFEMEIFPSQRDESEIIHSGEYTRLENTIAAAREALQIAQDTQNTIDAAEAVRQAQERLREAAEKAREIKESRREDDTAKAIAKCVEAMEAAIEQTKKCLTATEEANKIIISQSGLDAILAAVKDYYERIRELETDININVDGGTPKSTDLLLVKGGTPFTTDYDKYIAGTSHTI